MNNDNNINENGTDDILQDDLDALKKVKKASDNIKNIKDTKNRIQDTVKNLKRGDKLDSAGRNIAKEIDKDASRVRKAIDSLNNIERVGNAVENAVGNAAAESAINTVAGEVGATSASSTGAGEVTANAAVGTVGGETVASTTIAGTTVAGAESATAAGTEALGTTAGIGATGTVTGASVAVAGTTAGTTAVVGAEAASATVTAPVTAGAVEAVGATAVTGGAILLIVGIFLAFVIIICTIVKYCMSSPAQQGTEIELSEDTIYELNSSELNKIFSFSNDAEKPIKTWSNFLSVLKGNEVEAFSKIEEYAGKTDSPYRENLEACVTSYKEQFSKIPKDAHAQIKAKCKIDDFSYKDSVKTFDQFMQDKNPFGNEWENVNYVEIMSVMTQTDKFMVSNLEIRELKEYLKNRQAPRYLYRLRYLPKEKKTTDIFGTEKTIKYYDIEASKYCLADIYELFKLDPFSKNSFFNLENQEMLYLQSEIMRTYSQDVYIGIEACSNMFPQPDFITDRQTEINLSGDMSDEELDDLLYEDDIKTDELVNLDVPYINQGDYPSIPYGQGSIKSSGCCLCSLAMIGSYYTKKDLSLKLSEYASKDGKYTTYASNLNGYYINKNTMLSDLGIDCAMKSAYSLTGVMDSLRNSKPVMIHFPAGSTYTKSGHYAVIKGFNAKTKTFLMCDPGSRARTRDGISFEDMASNADEYYIYNYTKKSSSTVVMDTGSVEDYVFNCLVAYGYTKEAAAGIMGNIQQESQMNPSAIQGNHSTPWEDIEAEMIKYNRITGFDGYGIGLFQWAYSTRKVAFKNYVDECGENWNSKEVQMNFFFKELESRYRSLLPEKLNSLNSTTQTCAEFQATFEQTTSAASKRQKYAESIYSRHKN